jgi:hypothetical protein
VPGGSRCQAPARDAAAGGSRCQAPAQDAEMLAICGAGWKSVPGTCPRTRRDASNLRPDWKSVRNRCQAPAQDAEMLAICGAGWKSVPGTCPRTRLNASYLRAGPEVGARHLPRTRRDASNLRPDWKSVPGTCQGRGGMLAICGPGWKSVLEIGARHLS